MTQFEKMRQKAAPFGLLLIAGLVVLILLALVGCASPGSLSATQQELANGYAGVAAVRQTAAQELQAGAITVEQAQKVLAATDKARAALDAATTAMGAGDMVTEGQQVQAAILILQQVQQLLPKAQGTK